MSELLYKNLHPMIVTHYWPDMPRDELVAWIDQRHEHAKAGRNQGAVSVTMLEMEELRGFGFTEWFEGKTADIERSKPDKYWTGYWDETCKAGASGGWASGFPHRHGWPHGLTLAMVVQAPDGGGESVLVLDDDITEVPFMPMEGVGLVIPGDIKHGVKRVEGDAPRMVLIATAYGPEDEILWKS